MNYRLFALFIIAFTASPKPMSGQTMTKDSLTVRDAVELVLSRNPEMQEASHVIDASKARVDQSRSSSLPSADVEASYEFLSPVAEFDFPGNAIKVFPSSNYDGHIGVRQLIFDFQKTSSQVEAADSRVALAEDSREVLKRDLAFRSAEIFYSILYLGRSIEVQDDQIRTLNEHLLTAQKKIASGTATKLDALTTQVRVAGAQTVKVNLESALGKQQITFRRLAALPPDAPVNLKGEFSLSSVSLSQDSLLAVALSARVEAKAAQDAIESAKAQQQAARLNDAPSLNANLAYGFKNGYIPNIDVLRGNLMAGVELKVPIFDGNKARSMEEEATANLRAAEARKRDIELTVQADVQQALTEVKAATERVQITEINIRQADLAVETARLRYEAGAVSNLDVLDAETNLAQVKLTNLQARYDLTLSGLQLRRAIGSSILEQ